MEILPGHDEMIRDHVLTQKQLMCIAILQYLMAIIILINFIVWLRNFWKVIIKQEMYKVLPLLTFYVYSILLLAFYLYAVIWSCKNVDTIMLMIGMIPQTLKFIIGVGQSWVNIELGVITNQAMN